MLANSMADSSNIWQWCNARKKICRHGASSLSPRGSKREKEEEIRAQRYDRFSCNDYPLLYSSCSDSMNESKVLDGQCCFVELPTTPDLDHLDHKAQKLDSVAAPSLSSSSSFSAVVCGQTSADSSSSSVMHDGSAEDGMHLQAVDRSFPPSCHDKDLSPKIEILDLGLQAKGLSATSDMPFARNLRSLASRKPKPKIPFSSEGLDLLVKAICMLENSFSVWGNKELDKGRRPCLIQSAMQKKRVIRRARSAYQHRCKSKGELQLPMMVDSSADHVSLLDAVHKQNQNQAKQDEVESQDQNQTPQSHLASNLRRSMRSLRVNRTASLVYEGRQV